MKVRDVLKMLSEDGWFLDGREAVIASTSIPQNREW